VLPDDAYEQCCQQPQPDTQVHDVVEPPADVADVKPDLLPTDVADVKPDAIDCSTVCCMCDYGFIPEDVYKECCTTEPDVVEPPPDVIPDVPADVKPDAIDCSTVCCTCEYGIIPEDVYKECCTVQPDVVEPTPDVTSDVPVADQGPDTPPISCANVCCLCDYGIIPEDVWKECCDPCKDVCCDCDYGEPPPPQCCP